MNSNIKSNHPINNRDSLPFAKKGGNNHKTPNEVKQQPAILIRFKINDIYNVIV